MAEDDRDGMDVLRLPFVFVPHGTPDLVEFMRSCAEPLRIPATFRHDRKPFVPHLDTYRPTSTRTRDFCDGSPAAHGLIAPSHRPRGCFPHGGRPSDTDPRFYRTDPVAKYHRFNQLVDEAVRNYGLPDPPGPTQTSLGKVLIGL